MKTFNIALPHFQKKMLAVFVTLPVVLAAESFVAALIGTSVRLIVTLHVLSVFCQQVFIQIGNSFQHTSAHSVAGMSCDRWDSDSGLSCPFVVSSTRALSLL